MNNWMLKMSENIKGKKISEIYLPGSHDSSAYELDLSVKVNDGIFENVRKYGGFILSPLLKKWTVTQSYNIYDQLNNGIRYLDIRITEVDNEFYTSHSFICKKFVDILDQINNFSSENPSEIIIIDMTLDNYNKSLYKNNKKLENIISSHSLYKLCCKIINDEIPIYNEIIKTKTPIILLLDNELNLNNLNRLTYNKRFKKWTNSQTSCDNTIRTLINLSNFCGDNNSYIVIMEETLTPSDNEIIMSFVMQIVLTLIYIIGCIMLIIIISKKYDYKKIILFIISFIVIILILKYIFKNTYDSLNEMSFQVQGTLVSLLEKNIKLKKNINVISADFITKNFCKSVCDLNI